MELPARCAGHTLRRAAHGPSRLASG